MSDDPLVLTMVPALVAILLNREDAKGSPLTEEEVIAIRDSAACIALPATVAAEVAKRRGYDDIDPEGCWEQWQAARSEIFGRK